MPSDSPVPPKRPARRKTGPKPRFGFDDVVDAAIRLGIDSFTISGVAAELGVAAPAVYRIFSSREELSDACLGRATSSLHWPADAPTWTDVLRAWSDEAWNLCERFPGIDKLLMTATSAFSHFEEGYGTVVLRLCEFGFTPGQATFALDLLTDTVLSSHMNIANLRAVDDNGRSGFSLAQEAFTTGLFVPDDSWTERGFLDVKLDFIIAGLAERRPEVENHLSVNETRA